MQHDICSFTTLADRRRGDKAGSQRLPPLKERILSLIRRAGPTGITGDDLFAIAYDEHLPRYRGGHKGRYETRARSALKANIYQINQLIQATGYRIVGSNCPGGWYRLVRVRRSA
jgi:hypothetical protein